MNINDNELKLDDFTPTLEILERAILFRIFGFLLTGELCSVALVSKILHDASSDDDIWKDRAVARWPELTQAKDISKDEWKSLYGRKHKEGTNIQDFAKIYRGCDFYQCPNGHTFLIGECRLPMQIGRCPECNAPIGGKHHAMLRNNKRCGDVKRNILGVGAKDASLDNLHIILNGQSKDHELSHMRVIEERDVTDESDPKPPSWLTCPLTLELYKDPVATPSGMVYEREMIKEYLKTNKKCPKTGKSLELGDLKSVPETKRACERWKIRHPLKE